MLALNYISGFEHLLSFTLREACTVCDDASSSLGCQYFCETRFLCFTVQCHFSNVGVSLALLISALSLGVNYYQQLTLSVCLSVCHKLQIASSVLFLDEIEPFFGRQFSMCPSTKRCSSIVDLGPLMPTIYFPKFAQNHL